MKTISGHTDLYAILGNPIVHSMSPVIMNRNFERNNLDKVFLALKSDLTDFDTVFPVLIGCGFKGYVFTMPVKEIAVKYMEELSEEASIIGAINCAYYRDGKLFGTNTDSIGFWHAVQEKNSNKVPIKHMFIMGCGGFARAAIAQAAIQGVKKITVANHLDETAFIKSFNEFRDRLERTVPDMDIELIDWIPDSWKEIISDCDLIANATPNGMNGKGDLDAVFPFDSIKNTAIVFDAIYEPRVTGFLARAREHGFVTVEGIDLLCHQGTVSFRNYTGLSAEPSVMKEDILEFWETLG